jgi:hypothetical protein
MSADTLVLPPTFTAHCEWGVRYRGRIFYISEDEDDALRVAAEEPRAMTMVRRVVIEGPWE